MIYRGYEIRAELRTFSQHDLDDDGNELETINNSDECNLEGYYYVGLEDWVGENLPTIDDVKNEIDKLLDGSSGKQHSKLARVSQRSAS